MPCTTSRTTRQRSRGQTCIPWRRPSTTQLPLFPLPWVFTLLVSSFLSLFRLFFVFFAELQSYLKMLFSLINIIRTNHQSRCFKVHALAVIIDCAMGAWLGHDGFQWPGSGDYFHMLHHKVFTSICFHHKVFISICFHQADFASISGTSCQSLCLITSIGCL